MRFIRSVKRRRLAAAALAIAALSGLIAWHRPLPPPGTLRAGFAEFNPYISVDANGHPTGLAVQVVQRAAARIGTRLQWILVEDAEKALRARTIDIFPIFTVTPERQREFHMSVPWWESSQTLVSLRDRPLNSPTETTGKRIGIRDITASAQIASESIPGAFLVRNRDIRQIVTSVCMGEVDGAFLEGRLIYSVLLDVPAACGSRRLLLTPVPNAVNLMGTVATQAAAPAADRLYAAIQDLLLDGTVTEVANRWFAIPQQRFVRQRLLERQNWYLVLLYSAGVVIILGGLRFARRAQHMRRAAEEARAQAGDAERRFEAFMTHSPAASMIKDSTGHFLYVNRALEQALGRPADELRGKTDAEIWPADTVATMRVRDEEVLRTGLPVQYVIQFPGLSGRMEHWLALKFRLDGNGESPSIGVTAINITEQHRVAELIRESEERYRLLFEHAPLAMHEIDHEGLIRRINQAECQLFGLQPEEILGRHASELIAPEEREESRASVAAKLAGIKPLKPFERSYSRKDGKPLRIEVHETPILGASGLIQGIRSCLVDLTDRYEARQRLDQVAEQLQEKNTALGIALHSAEEATRLKGEFLANMSHEIRTPMNAVLGMTELMLESGLTPEQLSMARAVSDSGEHLLSIINDILDFSKIEAGKLQMERVAFDLTEVVEAAAGLMAPAAHAKSVELICYVEPEVPRRVYGDPARLRQVLLNLMGNAVKFTGKGHIGVLVSGRVAESGRALIGFSVCDTGIGIPAEAVADLFTAFTQADSSTTRRFGGTGLGLAIAKRIVNQIGGEMGVDSREGKGSTFWFNLEMDYDPGTRETYNPALQGRRVLIVDGQYLSRGILMRYAESWGMRATAAAGAEQASKYLGEAADSGEPFELALVDSCLVSAMAAHGSLGFTRVVLLTPLGAHVAPGPQAATVSKPVKPRGLFECLRALSLAPPDASLATEPPLFAAPPAAPLSSRRGRILIAEDNPVNQRVASLQVKNLGFQADVVNNGEEALAALARLAYTLVLMDCQMPRMDGFEATRELRKREAGSRHTPVIAMTANAFASDRQACLAAGMDDFVPKPVNLRELAAVLDRWSDVEVAAG